VTATVTAAIRACARYAARVWDCSKAGICPVRQCSPG
jgi:hypothetical protein